MKDDALKSAYGDAIKQHKEILKQHASYLGKNVDEVLKSAGQPDTSEQEKIAKAAAAELNEAVPAGAMAAPLKGDTWYTGSASLSGAIRGSCDAGIYFGGSGNYKFSGSMWTSPIVAAGGGAGAWSMIPSNGQSMNFTWWGASVSGGAVNILWNINGTIVGSMAIAVAGIGGGGGNGDGKWTKGD